jgi:hypothetical protein
MQATTRFHDRITTPVLEEADFVFHDPIALHPTHGVFTPDSDRRDPAIGGFLRRREFPPTGCSPGLDDGDPSPDDPLEAHILGKTTPKRQGIARPLREAFRMRLALIDRTQEANGTGLIEHEQVFARVALLLATVILLRLLRISRTRECARSTIMPARGDVAPSFVGVVARRVVTRRPCGPAAARAGLRPDSARDGGDESTGWHALGTSQRVALALLGPDSVSSRSA